MYAAESTITEAKDHETNWFDASESIVRPLHDTAQRAYKNFLADGSNANQQHWQASAIIFPPNTASGYDKVITWLDFFSCF